MNTARSRVEFWIALIWGLLLRLALAVGFFYCLYRVSSIIITVLCAVLLAVGIAPIVHLLDTPRLVPLVRPATRRFLVTLLVFILLFMVLVFAYYSLVTPLGEELTQLVGNWRHYQSVLQGRLEMLKQHFEQLPPDVQQFLRDQDFSGISATIAANVREVIQRTWHSTWVLMDLILIPVLAYYFVTDSRSLKKEFIFLVPRRRVREALMLLGEAREILKCYVIGQVILALIAGVVVGVGLRLLGINYSLAMGAIAAITRVIPIAGPILGGIPIVLLATTQSWQTGLWVLIFFSLLHLCESKILMPKLIGYQIHLHPAIIIIVLLIGAEFFGLIGMFLAAPVAAIVKVLVNYYVIQPRKRLHGRLDRTPGTQPHPEDLEIESTTFAAAGGHPRPHRVPAD